MMKFIPIVSIASALIAVAASSHRAQAWHEWGSGYHMPNMPSIPRPNLGGPRPDLQPANSPFCRQTWIKTRDPHNTYWYRVSSVKHQQRM